MSISSDFEPVKVQVGTVSAIDGLKLEVQLKNATGTELLLTNVNTSCGCLVGVVENERMIAGGTQRLRVMLNPGVASEKVSTQMSLFFKDVARPLQLSFEGDILPSVEISDFSSVETSEKSGAILSYRIAFSVKINDSRFGLDDIAIKIRRHDVAVATEAQSPNTVSCTADVAESAFGVATTREIAVQVIEKETNKLLGLFSASVWPSGRLLIAPSLPVFRRTGNGLGERFVISWKNGDEPIVEYLQKCSIRLVAEEKEVPIGVQMKPISQDAVMAYVQLRGGEETQVDWENARLVLAEEGGRVVGSVKVWHRE